MSSPTDAWTVRASQYYLDQLSDRRYRGRIRDLDKRIAVLLRDPYRAARAERLKHTFRGLRSLPVFEATRLIYRLWEECRRLGEQNVLPLDCCSTDSNGPRTLNILCLSEHYSDVPGEFDFDA